MAVVKKPALNFLLDIFLIMLAFALSVYLKPGSYYQLIPEYIVPLLLFIVLWVILSYASEKYEFKEGPSIHPDLVPIVKSNVLTLGMVAIIMYMFRISHFSRLIVLGTIGFTTLFELTFMVINYWFKSSVTTIHALPYPHNQHTMNMARETAQTPAPPSTGLADTSLLKQREAVLFVEINQEVYRFLSQYANIASAKTLILNTTFRFNIDSQLSRDIESIINLNRINDIRYLNKFFESANQKLPDGGIFIDSVETKNLRKTRILSKYPTPFNYIYYLFDFILKRIFPKFAITKKIYFTLTRGNNRVLTKAETYGRLYSCGFEIIAEKQIGNLLYFVARKVKAPQYPSDPTYGPFVKLRRIGKNGQLIKVYKLRTMHPFAEYLQEYIYYQEGLKEGGKFNGDFRVSTMGRFLRATWIDELPMFINFFRGEMKLVGVRPLSEQYFNLYSKELQEKRKNHKPGLIPPFYADYPKSLQEIQESEMKYLQAHEKHPFHTDVKYFFVCIFNILFRQYRSS